jgi:thiol-disulfide isomerase/thioredoxin
MRNILLLSLALLLLAGCGPRQKKALTAEGQQAAQQPAEQPAGQKAFPAIEVPMYLTAQEQRIEYLVSHYWDRFDFADTLYVETEALEKAYGEYAAIMMNYPDKAAARRGIADVMKKAEAYPAMYTYLWDMADKYFYDANSPVRDDEVYMGVLESVIANPAVDDLLKIAPREKLAVVKMNRPGHKANDFTYMSSNGARGTLYGIKADYTMIFFYNLGCPSCKQMREGLLALLNEPSVAESIGSGRLKILSMYPDRNKDEWKKYAGDIPADWINAYDPSEDNAISRLYDLKAIPSLYLLDKDKNVILKDFTEPAMLYYELMKK